MIDPRYAGAVTPHLGVTRHFSMGRASMIADHPELWCLPETAAPDQPSELTEDEEAARDAWLEWADLVEQSRPFGESPDE